MASKVLLAQYKMSYLNSPMFFRYIGPVHTHRLSSCKQGTHGAMVCSAVNIFWSHLDLFRRLFLLAGVSFFCRGRCGARALLRRSCCLQLGTGFLLRGHRLTGPMARRSFHGTFRFGLHWRAPPTIASDQRCLQFLERIVCFRACIGLPDRRLIHSCALIHMILWRRTLQSIFHGWDFIWLATCCKSVDQGIALGIPLGILQSLRVLQMNTFANSPDVPL